MEHTHTAHGGPWPDYERVLASCAHRRIQGVGRGGAVAPIRRLTHTQHPSETSLPTSPGYRNWRRQYASIEDPTWQFGAPPIGHSALLAMSHMVHSPNSTLPRPKCPSPSEILDPPMPVQPPFVYQLCSNGARVNACICLMLAEPYTNHETLCTLSWTDSPEYLILPQLYCAPLRLGFVIMFGCHIDGA